MRKAAHDDIAGMARVLGKAFDHDDPIDEYIFPDERVRHRRAQRMTSIMIRHRFLPSGGAAVATLGERIVGVLLWYPADYRKSLWHEVVSGPKLLAAMGSATRRGMDVDATIARLAPDEPHLWCVHLGCDPEVQGRGVGSALFGSLVERADAENVAIHGLCKDGNVAFYRRFGFEAVDRAGIGAHGPSMNVMLRQPVRAETV
ncbi:GNAT family N-acetyltransferase [Nocardia sp. CDC159]|uniref:GNAT family N-acetyltransferase n=1 Tax=Nocardia pulmonis TaxID=2951408 RepID=A0A9X2EDE4_9NOCA|nr:MULTISPECIES: GNAT family N-acetyltransferase [Nocardia]MCM6778857.1 GNAT family N-acetyltransferase [Nocardia pulmonis]MCM6791746.1 GNAT family N-acetyltransferase [Nocardia sp. CDC159]